MSTRRRAWSVLVSVIALAAVAIPAAPAEATHESATGLWDSDFTSSETASSCAPFSVDTNGFCYTDDSGSVSLGVKFVSAEVVDVTGVRVYRTDVGDGVTGSLWTIDGDRSMGVGSAASVIYRDGTKAAAD